jgi:hypothetical protein|tara:strand:- start:15419 stop:16084 length:666 start_codon:yes stop_codon:yes gene_type:complete
MELKKQEVNELLQSYCSTEPYREWMTQPFIIDDLAIATDAHLLITIPKKYCSIEVNLPKEKHQSVLTVIPKETYPIISIEIDLLNEIIDAIPIVDEYLNAETNKTCKTCDGDGNVEWVFEGYDKIDECPVCDGEGVLSSEKLVKTGYKIKDFSGFFDIKGCRIQSKHLYKIVSTANRINCKTIHLVYFENYNKAILLKLDEVKILVMPVTKNDEQHIIHKF